jgi:pimeloyl-ACP methyl ester carboxylesterase
MTTRRYLTVGEGQVHLQTGGSPDGLPTVLLHQVPSSLAMFESVVAPLQALGRYTIAIDLPGYGMSDPIGELPDLDDYARVVLATLDDLGVERADFIGHHTGAGVSMAIARMAPERVGALALWGVPMMEPERALRLANEDRPVFSREYGAELAANWTRRWDISSPAVAEWVNVRCVAEILLSGRHRPDGHRAIGREDTTALARSVTRPVLAMCGSKEMLREHTILSVAEFPDATLADIRDLGIDAFDEAPDELAELVDRFFRAPTSITSTPVPELVPTT